MKSELMSKLKQNELEQKHIVGSSRDALHKL